MGLPLCLPLPAPMETLVLPDGSSLVESTDWAQEVSMLLFTQDHGAEGQVRAILS